MQVLPQLPCAAPLQVSLEPQSESEVQLFPWQAPPPQVPLEPQSELLLQALVEHTADEQAAFELVPQSLFELQLAGAVHLAPLQVTPLAH